MLTRGNSGKDAETSLPHFSHRLSARPEFGTVAHEVLRRKAIGELRQDLGQLTRIVVALVVCTVRALACRSAGSHGIPLPGRARPSPPACGVSECVRHTLTATVAYVTLLHMLIVVA
jgi:hypothetical protein